MNRDTSAPYAQVIVPRPVRGLFTYSVPEAMRERALPGRRVAVPFGPRLLVGFIAARVDRAEVETKPIAQLSGDEELIPPSLLELILWTAGYYFAPPGELAALAAPRGEIAVDTYVSLSAPPPENLRPPKLGVIAQALAGGERKLDRLAVDLGVTHGALKKTLTTSAARRWFTLRQDSRAVKARHVAASTGLAGKQGVQLNPDQREAVDAVDAAMGQGGFGVFLLHGVTGSGKTEVYAELARRALEQGGSVLALAPEIAIAGLVARRLERRLGVPALTIHSELPPRERDERINAARRGQARLVVGARSAVFTPMPSLRLIIVDEEHDPTFKQAEAPRYHGRDVAIKRAQIEGVPILLGSATPSLESYHHAKTGKYRLLRLAGRIDHRPMPRVVIAPPGVHDAIGPDLVAALASRLARAEQAILFLNRRGAARYIQCSRCGHVFECRNCDISLVYHERARHLRCHTCGYQEPAPSACPACGGGELYEGGAGTQRVEREITRLFPNARAVRMDRDTTTRPASGAAILNSMEERQVDILIGTQMVTKGHDFPGVTLVGALSADDTLHMPDFRASERAFQQITQAAGRAGRGDVPGEVIVQTRSPESHALQAAVNHDLDAFYAAEAPLRQMAGYPPFTRAALIWLDAPTPARGQDAIDRLRPLLLKIARGARGVEILGPVEAMVFRVRNRYRWKTLLRAASSGALSLAIHHALAEAGRPGVMPSGARLWVDVDPVNMMG